MIKAANRIMLMQSYYVHMSPDCDNAELKLRKVELMPGVLSWALSERKPDVEDTAVPGSTFDGDMSASLLRQRFGNREAEPCSLA